MDSSLVSTLLMDALQSLFLYGVPVVVGVLVVGALASFLQAVTNIHEPAIGYAGRLGGAVLAIYATAAGLSEALIELLRSVLQ